MKILSTFLLSIALLAGCGGGEADVSARAAGAGEAAAATSDADLRTIAMTVPTMACPICVRSIRVRLRKAELRDIQIDLDTKLVRARFDPARITAVEVEALVEGQGFPVEERRTIAAEDEHEGGR